jgi:quinol-cytochrome oxidoreductase complex cytochrome b subunit
MQTILHFLLGALLGAMFVWMIFASFQLGPNQPAIDDKKPPKASKDFWRRSIYAALLGALIGLGIAAKDVFFRSPDTSPAYDSAPKVP